MPQPAVAQDARIVPWHSAPRRAVRRAELPIAGSACGRRRAHGTGDLEALEGQMLEEAAVVRACTGCKTKEQTRMVESYRESVLNGSKWAT